MCGSQDFQKVYTGHFFLNIVLLSLFYSPTHKSDALYVGLYTYTRFLRVNRSMSKCLFHFQVFHTISIIEIG